LDDGSTCGVPESSIQATRPTPRISKHANLPHAYAGDGGIEVILERTVELDQLGHLLVETESSGGCVVLVRGEAGIGKSTRDLPTRELAVKEAETRGILSGS
jgi:hypothetical protein